MAEPPPDPAGDEDDEAREQAIVEESIAALRGEPTTATDHERDRRRVRTVIDAIRAAGR
jgi:hypothetical protein